MRKLILMTFMLCFLSTQVLGSVVSGNEHKAQGDMHSVMHEIGQPHSHDHEDESNFSLSYSEEAREHINQNADCCVVGLLETFPARVSENKPFGAIKLYANNWSPPFLRHIKPPPKN